MSTRALALALLLLAGPAHAATVDGALCSGDAPGTHVHVRLRLTRSSWPAEDPCDRFVRYVARGPVQSAEQAAARLQAAGHFTGARCTLSADGRELACELDPARIVVESEIDGDLPWDILQTDVDRRMTLRPGAMLTEEELTTQRRRLESFLRWEGFFGSKVQIETEPAPGAEPLLGERVLVTVDAGPAVDLRGLRVQGESPLSEHELRERLTHPAFLWWFPERFRVAAFQDDLLAIEDELRERGWVEALVSGDHTVDLEREAVDVLLRIDAGPRLELRFEGNAEVDDDELREQATFATSGAADVYEVEQTAAALRRRYQEAGYPDAQVQWKRDEAPGVVRVLYTITEGRYAEVHDVVVEAARAVPVDELREEASLATRPEGLLVDGRWVAEQVEADVEGLREAMRRLGYASAQVEAERETLPDGHLVARFRVESGPRLVVRHLRLDGVPPDVDTSELRISLHLHPGAPFVEERLADDRRQVLELLAQHGYPQAQVEPVVDRETLTVQWRVEPGPTAHLVDVLVRGGFDTATGFIEDELDLDPDEPLDLIVLGSQARHLRSLGVFRSVEIEPLGLTERPQETWLLVGLHEREPLLLDLVVSFTTDELVSFGFDLVHRNLIGRAVRWDSKVRTGRALELIAPELRIGNVDLVQTSLTAPRPLGAPFDASVGTFYRYEDTELLRTDRLGLHLGVSKELLDPYWCLDCPSLRVEERYELGYDRRLVRDPARVDPELGEGSDPTGRFVTEIRADDRDSFIDPREGYDAHLRLDLALAWLSPFPGSPAFWRVTLETAGYLPVRVPPRLRFENGGVLGGPIVLCARVLHGQARPWAGGDHVPSAETFSYGGDASVRGLDREASVALVPNATVLLEGTAELRWYVLDEMPFGAIQLAGFADAGMVAADLAGLLDAPAVTAGPALRWVTPVGPLSVAYGFPALLPEGLESPGRLHLTFGAAF